MTNNRVQLKNKPTTLQDREQRLQALSIHTEQALNAFTLHELRELCAFLIPNARKLKKPEFVQTILEITQPYREERLQKTVAAIELMGDVGFSPEMISTGYANGLTPKQVSEVLITKLEQGNYSASTISKTKTKQIRQILNKISIENPDSTEWTDKVYEYIKAYAAKFHHEVNLNYGEKVENIGTGETMRHIAGEPVIEWCRETIELALTSDNLERTWHKLSLALAISSGRRMDEIHGDGTTFKVLDVNTIETTGLSKKKETDYVHVSPCLVDAYKWFQAYNKLPEKRRNLPNNVVNSRVAASLTESLKTRTKDNVIEQLFGSDDEHFKASYKTSRDFYVAYLITTKFNRIQHGTEINYAKSLLGHSAKRQTLSYQKIIII
jgi:hypothetical protein